MRWITDDSPSELMLFSSSWHLELLVDCSIRTLQIGQDPETGFVLRTPLLIEAMKWPFTAEPVSELPPLPVDMDRGLPNSAYCRPGLPRAYTCGSFQAVAEQLVAEPFPVTDPRALSISQLRGVLAKNVERFQEQEEWRWRGASRQIVFYLLILACSAFGCAAPTSYAEDALQRRRRSMPRIRAVCTPIRVSANGVCRSATMADRRTTVLSERDGLHSKPFGRS